MVAKAEQDSTPLIESGAADTATKRKDDAHRSLGSFGVAVVCFAAVAGGEFYSTVSPVDCLHGEGMRGGAGCLRSLTRR